MFRDDLQPLVEVNLPGFGFARVLVLGFLRRGVDRTHKQADEPGQRVLVHGVDVRQVADGEEQHRVVRSARLVPLSRGVNLNLRSLGNDLLLGDLVGYNLRLLEGLDARGVVEDVTLGRRKRVQNAVLDVLEALFVIRGFHDELLALRLQVGSLLRHDHAQELIAQAVERDHEVEKRHLHGGLRQVVRVAQ